MRGRQGETVRRFRCSLLTGRARNRVCEQSHALHTAEGALDRKDAVPSPGRCTCGPGSAGQNEKVRRKAYFLELPSSMELRGGARRATMGVRGRNVFSVKALPGVTSRGGSARGASKDAAQLGKPKRATARAPRRVDRSWHERIAPPIVGGPGSANCAGPMESPRGLTAS